MVDQGLSTQANTAVAYADSFGPETAPTVLLLHPAGVTLDLPAHGDHPLREWDGRRAVEDIGRVLAQEGSAVLVGHSMGGYVAMRAAAEYGTRTDGVVIAGAAHDWSRLRMRMRDIAIYPFALVFEAAARSDRVYEWLASDDEEAHYTDDQQPPHSDRTLDPHGTAQYLRSGVDRRTWEYIDQYDGVTMIVHGDEEENADHAGELAARIKADLRWLDGDHQAPAREPEQFTPVVESFLDEVYDGSEGEQ